MWKEKCDIRTRDLAEKMFQSEPTVVLVHWTPVQFEGRFMTTGALKRERFVHVVWVYASASAGIYEKSYVSSINWA